MIAASRSKFLLRDFVLESEIAQFAAKGYFRADPAD